MTHYGMLIGLKPEHDNAHKAAHRAVPEPVLRMIGACENGGQPWKRSFTWTETPDSLCALRAS